MRFRIDAIHLPGIWRHHVPLQFSRFLGLPFLLVSKVLERCIVSRSFSPLVNEFMLEKIVWGEYGRRKVPVCDDGIALHIFLTRTVLLSIILISLPLSAVLLL